jgi:DNA-binding beta-propeller fold protein YncE
MDVDSRGNLYVADRGSNLVSIFSPDGRLLRSISFNSPVSLAVLPEGEVAVTAPRGYHLVTVFDSNGRLVREFGDPEQLSEREDLNRYVSIGRLASDPQGHLYYGYTYLPEPLVRQYDRFGFAKLDFQFSTMDAFSEARATRREIERQQKRSEPPSLQPILTAFGVDPVNGDVWMALHNTLLHFDKDGNRRSEYQIYTKDGARIEANVILVEENRLLIGADPLGVFEFARPDRNP